MCNNTHTHIRDKVENLSGSEKSILRNLADRKNSKTGLICPSILTISKDTGYAVRTVYRTLRSLVDKGFISIDKRYNPGTKRMYNVYTINLDSTKSDQKIPDGCQIGTLSRTLSLQTIYIPDVHNLVNEDLEEEPMDMASTEEIMSTYDDYEKMTPVFKPSVQNSTPTNSWMKKNAEALAICEQIWSKRPRRAEGESKEITFKTMMKVTKGDVNLLLLIRDDIQQRIKYCQRWKLEKNVEYLSNYFVKKVWLRSYLTEFEGLQKVQDKKIEQITQKIPNTEPIIEQKEHKMKFTPKIEQKKKIEIPDSDPEIDAIFGIYTESSNIEQKITVETKEEKPKGPPPEFKSLMEELKQRAAIKESERIARYGNRQNNY